MASAAASSFQKYSKMGESAVPAIQFQTQAPRAAPARFPSRRSPRHTPKSKYSQTQTMAARSSQSAAMGLRRRRGSRKQWVRPRTAPSRTLASSR